MPSKWVPMERGMERAEETLFKQKVNKWQGELQFILFPYVLLR